MRLIFIEGVSGVGKSTTTQKLCDKLNEMRFITASYLEGNFANPIDFYCTAYFMQEEYDKLLVGYSGFIEDIKINTIIAGDVRLVRYYNGEIPLFTEPLLTELRNHEFCWNPVNLIELSEYTRVYKMVWENFAQNTNTGLEYLLFDGSLLHHPINDMMRNYNVTTEQAVNHVNSLIETVDSFRPIIIYLSSDNVAERLKKARNCRSEVPPSVEQIKFWEERKQMDLSVIQQLQMPFDLYDISGGNWDVILDVMVKHILETDDERRARIYPIILCKYNPAWPEWYAEEKANLERLLGDNIVRIQHIGSTAVPGLMAKPTVDILLEVPVGTDFDDIVAVFSPHHEYICLYPPTNPEPLCVIKGYTSIGFAEKVFHIHVRETADYNEPVFRDYLIAHPEAAAEYTELKRSLFKGYEHDRDGYTNAKGEFVRKIIKKAQEESGYGVS